MVTPCRTVTRDHAGHEPVRPLRAPLLKPNMSIGAFTELDVMFTIRPKPRFIMPSTDALMNSYGRQHVGVDRLDPVVALPVAEIARRRSARVVDDDVGLRTGGEHLLAAGVGRDVDGDRRHLHAGLLADLLRRRLELALVRALITRSTPSWASAMAQPLPKPLLAAQTIALRPLIPISIASLPFTK